MNHVDPFEAAATHIVPLGRMLEGYREVACEAYQVDSTSKPRLRWRSTLEAVL
jgi:hypothetical protein